MKKALVTLIVSGLFVISARADEGMWMLPLLEKINSEALQNLGSRLTPEQIYSVNHSSIKDAIVQFGGGCTGEMISGSGLLVTNHHCGYSSIQALSTDEHNYLEDGYFAKSRSEELPVPGLTVKFLQSMTDVTEEVQKAYDKAYGSKEMRDSSDVAKAAYAKAKVGEASLAIRKAAEAQNPNCVAQVISFFNDNVYYLVISKIYRDVRFVGAPPASSGKFGGDTDNWMWPRHTCDFSMFRVYAGPDNEPADYSADNVPMQPRQFLSISLKGEQEGDFAMIMGYPGRTQRYQTAAQLQEMLDLNDIRIAARGVRQDVLWKEMRADEKVGLQYASKYASSSNGWKKWIGEKEAFAKLGVIDKELEKEAALTSWIDKRGSRAKKYSGAISSIAEVVADRSDAYKKYTLGSETLGRIELLSLASQPNERAYKDYNADVDRKVALAMVEHYLQNADPEDRIDVDAAMINEMFDKSAYTSVEKMKSADQATDPAKLFADKVADASGKYASKILESNSELAEPTKAYAAALLEWKKGDDFYPDANSTCRLTYGTVKGYEPKDGVIYKPFTTLKGVIEKEDESNYEFRVPARVKEIYETSDYGQYADADGTLHTCFLTNLDITGGNSGSPVMDADGNLIGLAFDGNWEAMSGDVIFEPNLQRCICVDIRYVLLMVDKFAGAGYLLNEMNIVK